MIKLVEIGSSRKRTTKIELNRPIVIGKAKDCDVVLEHSVLSREISRQHAFIVAYGGEPFLGNLTSKGLYIRKKRILGYDSQVGIENCFDDVGFKEKFLETKRKDSDFFMEWATQEEDRARQIDEIELQRMYLLKRYLLDEENIKYLIDRLHLVHLDHGDMIHADIFDLCFKETGLRWLLEYFSRGYYYQKR